MLSNPECFITETPLSLHLVLAKRESGHQWVMVPGLTELRYVGVQGRTLLLSLWAPFALEISKGNQQIQQVLSKVFLVLFFPPSVTSPLFKL